MQNKSTFTHNINFAVLVKFSACIFFKITHRKFYIFEYDAINNRMRIVAVIFFKKCTNSTIKIQYFKKIKWNFHPKIFQSRKKEKTMGW